MTTMQIIGIAASTAGIIAGMTIAYKRHERGQKTSLAWSVAAVALPVAAISALTFGF